MNDTTTPSKERRPLLVGGELKDLTVAHRSALFSCQVEDLEIASGIFATNEASKRHYSRRRSDDLRYTRPTPFADFPEHLLTRDGEEQLMLEHLALVNAGADSIGLINPEKRLLAAQELSAQRIWRTRQNVKSFNQLMASRDSANETPGITDIINNAGVSNASMKDMAELLYVYPEAISGEFFDFVKPFDTNEIIRGLNILRAHLQQTAKNDIGDVIIDVDFDERQIEDSYDAGAKVFVSKRVLGTIHCRDGSSIEAVAKTTEVPLYPDDFTEDLAIEKPQRSALSLSAYLRRVDYKEREAYVEPREAQAHLDEIAAAASRKFGQIASLDTVLT